MSTERASPRGNIGETFSLTLQAEPQSARTARHFVGDLLDAEATEHWQLPAQLLVTELVTNAVLHARTDITVSIALTAETLRLEVRDHSPRLPTPRHYSAHATTGRGLTLIDRLSQEWGVRQEVFGKTVWAVLGPVDWEALIELQPESVGD